MPAISELTRPELSLEPNRRCKFFDHNGGWRDSVRARTTRQLPTLGTHPPLFTAGFVKTKLWRMSLSTYLYTLFQQNVRQRLDNCGWNQNDLAAAMGVGKSYVSQLLSGRANPGLRTLEAVAEALECEASDLISETTSTPG